MPSNKTSAPARFVGWISGLARQFKVWQAEEQHPEKVAAPILYCETNGVYIHFHVEGQKKAEVKVGVGVVRKFFQDLFCQFFKVFAWYCTILLVDYGYYPFLVIGLTSERIACSTPLCICR
jgi:hypothetical protein